MKDTIRTTVVLSRDLVEAVDQIAGARHRSEYVEEAVAEKVRRDRQLAALRDPTLALDPTRYPHWDTPEKTYAWVRRLRREADAHTMEKLQRGQGHDPMASPMS